jgi:hypothetical protein
MHSRKRDRNGIRAVQKRDGDKNLLDRKGKIQVKRREGKRERERKRETERQREREREIE